MTRSRSYRLSGGDDTSTVSATVNYDDFIRAHEEAIANNWPTDSISVIAEVSISEVLEFASDEQLEQERSSREEAPLNGRIDAIRDCLAAAVSGDLGTSRALLNRAFEWPSEIAAAESGLAKAGSPP